MRNLIGVSLCSVVLCLILAGCGSQDVEVKGDLKQEMQQGVDHRNEMMQKMGAGATAVDEMPVVIKGDDLFHKPSCSKVAAAKAEGLQTMPMQMQALKMSGKKSPCPECCPELVADWEAQKPKLDGAQ